ncbi:hypothetical protein CRUP_028860 [Coryphaenoides rupestris]|nr:hypothetical protein CRUP_028860 [Coryphaenoides rupestris]
MCGGETPFYAESLVGTYGKIMDHKNSLRFPEDVEMSQDVRDLISLFLTDREVRLGRSTVDEIQRHPFFKNNQWTFDTIRQTGLRTERLLVGDRGGSSKEDSSDEKDDSRGELKEKINRLEEQLDHEMQAKDELDQKCRHATSRLEKLGKELDEEVRA